MKSPFITKNLLQGMILVLIAAMLSMGGCGGSSSSSSSSGSNSGSGSSDPYASADQDEISWSDDLDMLNPQYYNSSKSSSFRKEVNKFVHFARDQYQMMDPLYYSDSYTVSSEFMEDRGSKLHAGVDLAPLPGEYVSYSDWQAYDMPEEWGYWVNAAHDGYMKVRRELQGYGQSIYISDTVFDDRNKAIGKVTTVYGHLDKDYMDEYAGWDNEGDYVNEGYEIGYMGNTGTSSGAHLHFEIRYYKPGANGTETYYGSTSAGGRSRDGSHNYNGVAFKGYWNDSYGYGYGNPTNHGLPF